MSFAVGADAVKFVSFMKKLLAILIMLMYGFSSTGMTISLHYCCGKLKSIDWTVPKHKSCDHQQKMAGKPCCETKLISYKDKSDQDASGFILKPAPAVFIAPQINCDQMVKQEDRWYIPEVFASPPHLSLPLYISNRVFRI